MQIVVVSPSAARFDATTHYWHAEFAAEVADLRRRFPNADVTAIAAGLINAPDRIIVPHLIREPDFLLIWARVWEAPSARKVAGLARQISPRTRILVWGDAPLFMRQYFERDPFNAAVIGGDPELVLGDAIARMALGLLPEHGMTVRTETGWQQTPAGRFLDPALWPFPAPDVVGFDDYQRAQTLRGKPTADLSFEVSRGCPVGCVWCVDPLKGGKKDRRRPASSAVDYMAENLGEYTQFQCHGPIFTQDRRWIAEFVAEIRRRQLVVPFKAVTLARHLEDEMLVGDLASVGMRAIGFGVETLTAEPSRDLLTPKNAGVDLARVARNLQRNGVEGKAYTQIGLPGQRRADVGHTHRLLRDLGLTIRPTGATPFNRLRGMSVAELDGLDLTRWDRKSYYDPACGLTPREFYGLLTRPTDFELDPLIEEGRECLAVLS